MGRPRAALFLVFLRDLHFLHAFSFPNNKHILNFLFYMVTLDMCTIFLDNAADLIYFLALLQVFTAFTFFFH